MMQTILDCPLADSFQIICIRQASKHTKVYETKLTNQMTGSDESLDQSDQGSDGVPGHPQKPQPPLQPPQVPLFPHLLSLLTLCEDSADGIHDDVV